MLLHIPGVLDPLQVERMRQRLQQAQWADGRETVGAQGAQVKRNLQLPDAAPLRRELGEEILAALASNTLFHSAVLPARVLPPRFNRYEGGGEYGMHVDGGMMALDGANGWMRSDVSCTLFLSEPDSYDGGALVVSDTYGEHEVKLPAGDLIVYPADSLHRVEAVTQGARLAAFFWVQSLVRDVQQRRMLLELDASVRQLTAAGADGGALLQLTNLYHNLLRLWGEP
jgi:PKHD-type hydroxylase